VLFDVDGTLLLTHDEVYVEVGSYEGEALSDADAVIANLDELEHSLAALS
jgi:hypothetical protein